MMSDAEYQKTMKYRWSIFKWKLLCGLADVRAGFAALFGLTEDRSQISMMVNGESVIPLSRTKKVIIND